MSFPTVSPDPKREHDPNEPEVPMQGAVLPSLALAVLAVALFAAGIVILLFTIGTDLGRDFWARFGLHLLASWCLAGGVVLIASRSEELTPGATMLEA